MLLAAISARVMRRRVAPPPSGGSDILSWDATTGAVGYWVYWSTTSWGYLDAAAVAAQTTAGKLQVVGATSVASWSSFTGIGTGVRYFNIRAYDESGDEGQWIADTDFQKTVT